MLEVFMAGWASSDRRERLPANWVVIRKRILRRDGGQCTERLNTGARCPEVATDVDHIRPGDDHSDSNLTSLCGWHHSRKSSREGGIAYAKKKRQHAAKFRRSEDHPGLT